MAKKRKQKPEEKIPVDPGAQVFQPGDEVVVQRPNIIWSGYRGTVESVDGGMCHCLLNDRFCGMYHFRADIPAKELALDL